MPRADLFRPAVKRPGSSHHGAAGGCRFAAPAVAGLALCCVRGTSRMNWAWATSLDHLWRSPAFPMWLTLAAAGFFGLILLITLLRAERSVANGALTVITLLAIGIAVAATMRVYGPRGEGSPAEGRAQPAM